MEEEQSAGGDSGCGGQQEEAHWPGREATQWPRFSPPLLLEEG